MTPTSPALPDVTAARHAATVTMPAPRRDRAAAVVVAALGLALALVTFVARGGNALGRAVPVEMALLVACGLGAGLLVLLRRPVAPLHPASLIALAALAGLATLTLLSMTWAVDAHGAWIEAGRTATYVAAFATAVAAARRWPQRAGAILGAIAVAGLAVCAFALATRVVPGWLAADETNARLRQPYGYWNAVGLAAAIAVPVWVWVGARRQVRPVVAVAAYPAVGLLLVCLLLSYSRGSLVALAAGLALWFVLVPLRLRGGAVLLVGAAGALPVVAWAFSQRALSEDQVPLALRESAGATLGLLLGVLVVGLTAAGAATLFWSASRPPREVVRRRIGVALLCGVALLPFAGALALSTTDRGLGGSVSFAWRSFTDPSTGATSNTPGRLADAGSARARYWDEARRVFLERPLTGVGAGSYGVVRKRFSRDDLVARHAHGQIAQTLADLGVLGLALTLLALGAWLVAAVAALGLRGGGRRAPWPPERVALATLTSVFAVFVVHSAADWTWFVPGLAVVAFVAAGWVAGRAGRPAAPRDHRAGGALLRTDAPSLAVAALLAVAGLAAAWSIWQPLRSQQVSDAALDALSRGDLVAAQDEARRAQRLDPTALEPDFALAAAQAQGGRLADAEATLRETVREHPSHPTPWLRLALARLELGSDPQGAVQAARVALFLDPRSGYATQTYVNALRAAGGPGAAARAAGPAAAATTTPAAGASPRTTPAATTTSPAARTAPGSGTP